MAFVLVCELPGNRICGVEHAAPSWCELRGAGYLKQLLSVRARRRTELLLRLQLRQCPAGDGANVPPPPPPELVRAHWNATRRAHMRTE